MLARLRLVAGTDVIRGAGCENFKMSLGDAIKEAAAVSESAQADSARAAIYALDTGVGTVRELLTELNETSEGVRPRVFGRNHEIMSAMRAVGLFPVIADDSDDLVTTYYGSVLDPKKLLKAAPALRAVESVLDGLTF